MKSMQLGQYRYDMEFVLPKILAISNLSNNSFTLLWKDNTSTTIILFDDKTAIIEYDRLCDMWNIYLSLRDGLNTSEWKHKIKAKYNLISD